MGLFDILRRLFGGDGSEPPHTGDEPDAYGGTHGSHWDALVEGEEIEVVVMNAVESGDVVEASADGMSVVGYFDGSEGCRTCTVTVESAVWTAYPEVDGVVHDVTVEEVFPWGEEGIEAQLQISLGEATCVLFDTRQFAGDGYEPGETREFSIAGVVYRLFEADEETVETDSGEEYSTAEMAGFFPIEEGQADDYAFQTTVKDVETLSYRGQTVYRLRVPLFRTLAGDDNEDVDIDLYAAEHVADGFEPTVGDDIRGLLWLQGRAA